MTKAIICDFFLILPSGALCFAKKVRLERGLILVGTALDVEACFAENLIDYGTLTLLFQDDVCGLPYLPNLQHELPLSRLAVWKCRIHIPSIIKQLLP
jgi:hypothetical protein